MKEKLVETIFNIDSRIKNCLVEINGETVDVDNFKFYVKVWFNYKHDYSNAIHESGRTEFVANTVKKLIPQIKTYFNTDHKTYIIV